jgi:lipid A ethanolaminephosphotransferase
VEWEDNNTGSKHVADRQREEDMNAVGPPALCQAEGCFDEVLVEHLRAELAAPPADKVFVLHQIGSHGPAYYQRYPPEFERFTPSCRSNTLQDCTPEQIRNSYDNTILYTDHVLGELVRLLQQHAGDRDAALLYVSDHGESTGEHGLYLHGAPRMLAPAEQTEVPMLFWASDAFLRWRGLAPHCLHQHGGDALSHDNLFHSVLGLLDIHTRAYHRELDVFASCAQA